MTKQTFEIFGRSLFIKKFSGAGIADAQQVLDNNGNSIFTINLLLNVY